jgi:uncharacterized repeat protein (TIGR03847 family)
MSVDLGSVQVLGAEAIGEPGQRRFRLFVENAEATAILWMEKEQLNRLALALDQALAQVTEGQILRTEAQAGGNPSSIIRLPADFPQTPGYEFAVGHMQLSYDGRNDLFLLKAVPGEIFIEAGLEPRLLLHEEDALSFFFTQQQAQALSSTITAVVTSGRPTCPLCGAPLDEGPHSCVQQNGHREIIQMEDEGE